MSACRRASVPFLCLLGCFLQVLVQGEVFGAPRAVDVFLRSKRANLHLLEEILQGNLERECHEEVCSYEEAREYFEDTALTNNFWKSYYARNHCEPNPCLHGGNCTNRVGGFHCSCAAPHHGTVCELAAPGELVDKEQPPSAPQGTRPVVSECLTEGPTACHQLCMASYRTFTCSCMPGFKLQTDGRTCLPEVAFPCGRLPERFDSTASVCHHGNCPWQVTLLNHRGVEVCGGVLLGRSSILTAARCLFLDSGSDLQPSKLFVFTGQKERFLIPVRALHVHNRFRADHHDYDLALIELVAPLPFSPTLIHLCLPTKDFSENILMHSGRTGVAERWGVSQTQKLVYMTLDECRSQLNVSHLLSNKMFCMRRQSGAGGSPNGPLGNQNGTQESPNQALGSQNGAQQRQNQNQTQNRPNGAENSRSSVTQNQVRSAAGGSLRSEVSRRQCGGPLPGTPVATVHHGTAFLTGLLMSPSSDCDGLVFTKLSRYLSWIKLRLEAAEDHMTPQISLYPETR